jgi:hypothetical protein
VEPEERPGHCLLRATPPTLFWPMASRVGPIFRPRNDSRKAVANGLGMYPCATRGWMSEDRSRCRPGYQPARRRAETFAGFNREAKSSGSQLTGNSPQAVHHSAARLARFGRSTVVTLGSIAHMHRNHVPASDTRFTFLAYALLRHWSPHIHRSSGGPAARRSPPFHPER